MGPHSAGRPVSGRGPGRSGRGTRASPPPGQRAASKQAVRSARRKRGCVMGWLVVQRRRVASRRAACGEIVILYKPRRPDAPSNAGRCRMAGWQCPCGQLLFLPFLATEASAACPACGRPLPLPPAETSGRLAMRLLLAAGLTLAAVVALGFWLIPLLPTPNRTAPQSPAAPSAEAISAPPQAPNRRLCQPSWFPPPGLPLAPPFRLPWTHRLRPSGVSNRPRRRRRP